MASDGSGAARLTACPGSVCDEHSAAWSPDGTRVAFVTTDAAEQTQIAVGHGQRSQREDHHERTWAAGHAPLVFQRQSHRLSLLRGCPQDARTLNPLARDAGLLSSTVYEQRLALISRARRGGGMLGPTDLNITNTIGPPTISVSWSRPRNGSG